jgi:transcription antitermination factor NusG
MTTPESYWYVAHTVPRYEKKVHDELVKKQVEVYLPVQKVYRQWSDRVKKIDVPLFPSYVFIKGSESDKQSTLRTKGVLRFVSFGGKPAQVCDRDINAIKKLENEVLEVEQGLVEGSLVRIIRGPLAGFEGVLFSKKGKYRFGVRIDTIKHSLSLEVPITILEELHPDYITGHPHVRMIYSQS